MLCTASTRVVAQPLLQACCALAQGTLHVLLTGTLSTRRRQTACKVSAAHPCGCEEAGMNWLPPGVQVCPDWP